MSHEPEEWTLDGFLEHVQRVHETMHDHQFCWILGAGASRSAGIPTGAELVEWWLQEMHLRECADGKSLQEWASAETLRICAFDYQHAAEFYTQVYERRFRGFPEEGFAYLEHVMTGNAKRRGPQGVEEIRPAHVIEPGPGYSVLAKIMETQRHRVAITTNFDSLIADALHTYTDTYPLVCGHESLTGFVNVAMRRPVVCKIHRDLFFAPLNEPRKLRLLHESWLATLRALLGQYTPIVIGYGGNDDSLMGRLTSLEPSEIKGRLIWCYYRGKDGRNRPSERIRELVGEQQGVLVPVPDFDRLLILLGARLGVEVLDQELERRQNERIKRYRDAVLELETSDLPQLKTALKRLYQRAGWWWWQLRVNAQPDPAEKEAAYREAIEHCPNSQELMCNFANFLWRDRANYGDAEHFYRKALNLDPKSPLITGNFAVFLTDVRGKYDDAERLFRNALELDPYNAMNVANFAKFLTAFRMDHDEAERLFRSALHLDPDSATTMVAFAVFLTDVRGKHDDAERLFCKALELDPNNAGHTGNNAFFLWKVRRNYDEAERLLRRSIELDPRNATNVGAFAVFSTDVRGNHDEAERLFCKAIDTDPNNATNLANYAKFLSDVRRAHDEAERCFRKALVLDPNNHATMANGACFFWRVRGNYDEAERLFRSLLERDPNNSETMGDFAVFLTDVRGNDDEAERLFHKSLELDPNNAALAGNTAFFLWKVRGNYDDAERLLRRSLELDPRNAANSGAFAVFLTDVRGNHDDAERFFQEALECDPNSAAIMGNYARFLTGVRLDHGEAERLYRKALELDPINAVNRCAFAVFLTDVRGNHDDAEQLFRNAIELDPSAGWIAGACAGFLWKVRGAHDEAEQLYRNALKLDPDHGTSIGNFAGLLIARQGFEEASSLVDQAFRLNTNAADQLYAELLIYKAILERRRGNADERPLTELHERLQRGFRRASWDFEPMFKAVEREIDEEAMEILRAYGAAVLDADKAAVLDETLELVRKQHAAKRNSRPSEKPNPARRRPRGHGRKR